MGLDTKIYWLTDRQSQCDFDFGLTEKSDVASRSWQATNQGHELVMERSTTVLGWEFLSVEDSHEKFVVGEEFEVSLWRLNVWFEDFMCAVVQWYLEWDSYSSCVKIRCQQTNRETFAEELPLLRSVTKQRLLKTDLEVVLWVTVNCLWLRVIVKEGVNKSNHPIRSPLL
jgi:hypothetical protein